MTIKEQVAALKSKMNNRLTKESPKETIDFIAEVNKDLDSLQEKVETLEKEKAEIQEMYIGAVRSSGSKEAPKEEEEKKPRTMEEIGAEIKAKEDGGKK